MFIIQDFFQGEPLNAITLLTYSDNIDLQRSAALALVEVTETRVCPVERLINTFLFFISF
jgi:vacuolar protein 8